MSDIFPIAMLAFPVGLLIGFAIGGPSDAEEREWITSNIEANYSVRDVEVEFPDGVPDRDKSGSQAFSIDGISETQNTPVIAHGYLDFDEQVVVIGDDLDGAVVPVDGSDAERVLATTGQDGEYRG